MDRELVRISDRTTKNMAIRERTFQLPFMLVSRSLFLMSSTDERQNIGPQKFQVRLFRTPFGEVCSTPRPFFLAFMGVGEQRYTTRHLNA